MTEQVTAIDNFRKILSVVLWPEPRVTSRFAAALIMFITSMFWGIADTAIGQRRGTTVDVGRTASYGLQKEVYPRSIKISSNPRGIATVRLDTDKSKLRIVGTSPGNTLVTVSGTYRELQVGGRVVERARPFKVSINVTVLPRRLEPDRRAIDVPVSQGKTRNYDINTFMGPEFTNEDRSRWRNFRVNPGDNGIARARLNGMSIGITGVTRGRTTITLTGERRFQGAWQQVVRNLQVRVGAATRPGTNEEERPDVAPSDVASSDEAGDDAWLDGLRRQYQQLQPSVESGERGELSAEQKAELRRRLENLRTVVETGIRNLERAPDRSEERLAARRALLGDIQRNIGLLQEDQSTSAPGTDPENKPPPRLKEVVEGWHKWLDRTRRIYAEIDTTGYAEDRTPAKILDRLESLRTVTRNAIGHIERLDELYRREIRLTEFRMLLAEVERDIKRRRGN